MLFKKKLIISFLLIQLILLSNCFSFNSVKLLDLPPKGIELTEHLISGTERDKILIISIDGVISDHGSSDGFGFSSKESMVARIKEELSKASLDSDVKGLILKINSPGGGVTPSDIIYKEIKSFKETKRIPVVALFMDTAASGGYYVAMAADKIVAHPTTVTGSIGVVIAGINIRKGLEKIGVEDQSIVSGENKTILSPLQEMRPDQKEIIQSIVNDMYERFLGIVSENRSHIPKEKLRKLADGRIYTASQAEKEKLIDKIGYSRDAIDLIKSLPSYNRNPASINNDPKIITYSLNKKPIKNIYQIDEKVIQEKSALQMILNHLDRDRETLFMYLWTY